jgi:hypothetical protein
VPPNNARLLGELVYLTDLDVFETLATDDRDLGHAVRTLAASAGGTRDPFAALLALASATRRG